MILWKCLFILTTLHKWKTHNSTIIAYSLKLQDHIMQRVCKSKSGILHSLWCTWLVLLLSGQGRASLYYLWLGQLKLFPFLYQLSSGKGRICLWLQCLAQKYILPSTILLFSMSLVVIRELLKAMFWIGKHHSVKLLTVSLCVLRTNWISSIWQFGKENC